MQARTSIVLAIFVLSVAACGDKKDDKSGDGESTPGEESKQTTGVSKGTTTPTSADRALFAKDMRKKGCDLLPPKLVASTFDVPENELKQTKVMGCIYNWKRDGQMVEARITLLRAHKTEDSAKRWFKNATRSLTKEEMAAQMQEVKKRMNKRNEGASDIEKKTGNTVVDLASASAGQVKYEDVPGIGDEARISTADGTLWVRVKNLTFNAAAYKGAPMKKIDYKPEDARNVKKLTATATKAQKAWLKDTADVRRELGIKLAKLIVGNL